jgi:hypothetical protein
MDYCDSAMIGIAIDAAIEATASAEGVFGKFQQEGQIARYACHFE